MFMDNIRWNQKESVAGPLQFMQNKSCLSNLWSFTSEFALFPHWFDKATSASWDLKVRLLKALIIASPLYSNDDEYFLHACFKLCSGCRIIDAGKMKHPNHRILQFVDLDPRLSLVLVQKHVKVSMGEWIMENTHSHKHVQIPVDLSFVASLHSAWLFPNKILF